MKARNRTLIALAIGAALAAPVAFAQNGQAGAKIGAGAGVPNPVPAAQQSLDRAMQATERAMDATSKTQDRAMDATSKTQDRATDATSKTQDDAGQVAQEQTESAPPAPPVQSQGSANASAHASVSQRALWDKLDADKDGAISATEADADAGFDAGFAKMDSDGNGTVSDAEYTAYAKTDLATSGEHAADNSKVAADNVWRQFDADADGKLSVAEVEADAGISGSFSAMDEDSDGFVTETEYRSYAKANTKPEDPTP